MRRNTCDARDMPEAAALIRLMAQCSAGCDLVKIRTLLRLLRALRDHPDLPRQSAVLASLAEAHAIWVQKLAPAKFRGRCPRSTAFGPAGSVQIQLRAARPRLDFGE